MIMPNPDKEEIANIYKRLHGKIPVFQALADDERLKLLLQLLEAGSSGVSVNDLAARSRLSRPAVSHHLKMLKNCGIITPHKTGTRIFYVMDAEKSFRELKETIALVEKMLAGLDVDTIRQETPWIMNLVDLTAAERL